MILSLLAFAITSATCLPPGTVATVTWSDSLHPIVYVRVEPNPDGKSDGTVHPFPAPGFDIREDQIGPVASSIGTVQFVAMKPGPWLAYYIQSSPYMQMAAVQFTCQGPAPAPPSPPPVPSDNGSLIPRLIISVQSLDQQPNGTWRIHGDPPLTSLFLLISVNGLTTAQSEYVVEFDRTSPDSMTGQPVIITAIKPWSGIVEARWWYNYTGQ